MHKLKKSVVSALALTMICTSVAPAISYAGEAINQPGVEQPAQVSDDKIESFKIVRKEAPEKIIVSLDGKDGIQEDDYSIRIVKGGKDVTEEFTKGLSFSRIPDTNKLSVGMGTGDISKNIATGEYEIQVIKDGKIVVAGGKAVTGKFKYDKENKVFEIVEDTGKPGGNTGTETPGGSGTETPGGSGTETPGGSGTETPGGSGTETPGGETSESNKIKSVGFDIKESPAKVLITLNGEEGLVPEDYISKDYSIKILKGTEDVTKKFTKSVNFSGKPGDATLTFSIKDPATNFDVLDKTATTGVYTVQVIHNGKVLVVDGKNVEEKFKYDKENHKFTKPGEGTEPSEPSQSEAMEITGVMPDNGNVEGDGGEVSFYVHGKNLDKDKLGVRVKLNNEKVDIQNISIEKGNDMGTKLDVKINIPENDSRDQKKYVVELSTDKNFTKIDKTFDITQAGNENVKAEVKVNEFTASKTKLSNKDRETNFVIKGENLDNERVTLKFVKDGKDVTSEVLAGKKPMGPETGNILTLKLSLPETKSEAGDNYKVSVLVDGKEAKSVDVSVSSEGTVGELQDLQFLNTYIDEDKIVLESRTPISEITEGTLKDNIKIDIRTSSVELDPNNMDASGSFDFKPLGANDKVEIKGKSIIITLTGDNLEKMKKSSMIVLKIEQNTLKNDKNNPYKEAPAVVYNDKKAIVKNAEIVKGELYDSKGGDVEIKLTGVNLEKYKEEVKEGGITVTSGTKVMVYKNGKFGAGGKRELLDATVEGEGNEQTIKFKLPENKTDRTETYSVRISLDGGKTYSSDTGFDVQDRTKRLVSAVLPEGKTKDDQTLSFMSIQSYGTSGGGEEAPDNTHTDAYVGQASKKTFVTVYGTNLDQNKTKVRIVDENGVIWTPVNEPSNDSADRFTMVGFNGTGIEGNGNVQMLEVIMPRGYGKTADGRDNTFTYQIAIDGVNFDQEVVVTATVVDDGSQGKKPLSYFVRDVALKYETADGNKVADTRNVKLMSNQPLYATEAMPIEIDGYKYTGIKGFEQTPEMAQKLKEAEKRKAELTAKAELTEEEKKELGTVNKLIEGHKHDELVQKVGDRSEIVFQYEKVEKPSGGHSSGGHSSSSSSSSSSSKPENTKREFSRISGSDRYKTALSLSNKAYKKADKVFLVSGNNFADALTAAALTKGGEGPVLLVNDNNIGEVEKEIGRLGAKEVVVVGGQALSSTQKETIAKNAKVSMDDVFGKDRYETSVKTAEKVISKFGNKGKVILVDGRNYPDAVSIAPYAAKEGIPVILVRGDKLTESAKQLLKKHNINEAIVIGGENSVGKSVEGMFSKVERIAGSNRYETSKKIAEKYFPNATKAFVATGENYADALSSGYYAAMNNAPVILTKSNKLDASTKAYFEKNKHQKLEVIGGESSVSSNLFK